MEDFKILLVDDEEEFLVSLSERLALRDLNPDTATSGEQALERIRAEEPTVIVLDLKMPGMHGLEVLRRVKKLSPHVQIVILTGHGDERDREEAEKLGAYAYLRKPVAMDTLMKTIQGAYKKFVADLRPDGKLLYDDDLVELKFLRDNIHRFGIPATRLAEQLGRKIVANIVMLGFLTAVTEVVDYDSMKSAILDTVPPGTEELNLKAYNTGYDEGVKSLEHWLKQAKG